MTLPSGDTASTCTGAPAASVTTFWSQSHAEALSQALADDCFRAALNLRVADLFGTSQERLRNLVRGLTAEHPRGSRRLGHDKGISELALFAEPACQPTRGDL